MTEQTDLPPGDPGVRDTAVSDDRVASRRVERGDFRLHVREQAGEGPAIVLMHGFPDNHHLYDRLVPHSRAAMSWRSTSSGGVSRTSPPATDYTFANQDGDLDAVIAGSRARSRGARRARRLRPRRHQLGRSTTTTRWRRSSPSTPSTACVRDRAPNPPEADPAVLRPGLRRLTRHFAASPAQFRWLYDFQVGGFIRTDPRCGRSSSRCSTASSRTVRARSRPFMELNADLNAAVLAEHRTGDRARDVPRAGAHRLRRARPLPGPPAHGRALAALFPRARPSPSRVPATSPSSTHP